MLDLLQVVVACKLEMWKCHEAGERKLPVGGIQGPPRTSIDDDMRAQSQGAVCGAASIIIVHSTIHRKILSRRLGRFDGKPGEKTKEE